MSRTDLESGRSNQKLRTRRALLRAAKDLMDEGKDPVIDLVAERAMVSRATAYRYFANTEKLAFEAWLEATWEKRVWDEANLHPTDVVERVSQVQVFLWDNARENELQFRLFMGNAMKEWVETKGRSDIRGGRRLPMIEVALEPIRDVLPKDVYERLRDALAGMMGIDSLMQMRDICKLDYEKAKATTNWAVKQLVRSLLPLQDSR